jgi:hypothetical protein
MTRYADMARRVERRIDDVNDLRPGSVSSAAVQFRDRADPRRCGGSSEAIADAHVRLAARTESSAPSSRRLHALNRVGQLGSSRTTG